LRPALLLLLCLIIFVGSTIMFNKFSIRKTTADRIYSDVGNLPKSDVGLLLGTMKHLHDGSVFSLYQARIDGAVKLYQAQKVDRILISATMHNSSGENEVEAMHQDLLKAGIPAERIELHEQGERTFASIEHLVNSEQQYTIISQEFHLARALFIAEKRKVKAVGYAVPGAHATVLTDREHLARLRMRWDLLIH